MLRPYSNLEPTLVTIATSLVGVTTKISMPFLQTNITNSGTEETAKPLFWSKVLTSLLNPNIPALVHVFLQYEATQQNVQYLFFTDSS